MADFRSPLESTGRGARSLFRGNPWMIVLGVAVLLGLWMIFSYNGFIGAKAEADTKWADVETTYQRRADLIPNLVATVKGAANFEQETFTEVTAARSAWAQAKTIGNREAEIAAAGNFDSALSRLLVTVEAYPQLKATEAYRDLSAELAGTENRITTARQDYNAAAKVYNVKIARFPGNLMAGLFGFEAEKLFAAQEGADTVPTVDFTQ